nr:heme o synthase [Polyangium mundeleinium]
MTIPAEPLGDVHMNRRDSGYEQRGPSFGAVARDLVALTKPRVTVIVVATMLGGAWVANRFAHEQGLPGVSPGVVMLSLLATVLVVGGANALNMYLERDTDGFMARTKNRPLPAGRISPKLALWFGLAISALSLGLFGLAVNMTTTLLAAFALFSYVLIYTPLKRKTTLALLIGSVPGAIPPLLGWTTVTDRVDGPGAALFGILFLWQVPHFLAISMFRSRDYQRAGLKVLPIERGDRHTRHQIVGYLVLLVLVSLLLVPLGVAGPVYLASAALLGLGFLGFGAWGLRPTVLGTRWARRLFAISIVYLMLLHAALIIGA